MAQDLGRLKDEQLSELRNTGAQIRQWEKFKEDYKQLQDRLQELPNRVRYDIMVPLGPLAFMPGQLVHTNEILVLLGENWFVEKSAKEACEVIDRRKQSIAKTIDKFNEQKQLLESRLEFTSDIQKETSGAEGIVDIREEYDPEKEAKWREKRAKRKQEVVSTKTTEKETGLPDGGIEKEIPVTRKEEEAGLWAKLDELERQEEEMDELARMVESLEESSEENLEDEVDIETKKKSVKWKDQEEMETVDEVNVSPRRNHREDEMQHDDQRIMNEEEEDDQANGTIPTILFSHSDAPSASPSSSTEMLSSPADIYRLYQTKMKETIKTMTEEPKSILKESSKISLSQNPEAKTEEDKPILVQPIPESAFSGSVIEHKSTVTDVQPKKRVSKFKQARQVRGDR